MVLKLTLITIFQSLIWMSETESHSHFAVNTFNSPYWPQLDISEHVPGEPLSPNDYQNADVLLTLPIVSTALQPDPIEIAGLFEGDIILTNSSDAPGMRENDEDESMEHGIKNAIVRENQKWPGGIIPYVISAQFNAIERSTIARAFLEYQRNTCILFKPQTTERDYIHILKGNGCSSHVGRTGGAQPVILGNGCVYPGIAMHELMHAVGFWHEQSRWDRDEFVSIQFQNIAPGMEFNFQKYTWRDIQNLSVTYDTSSILHYGPTAFAKDKRYPTIVPKKANDKMGQRTTFSPSDILKINRLYNCGGAGIPPPVTTTTPNPPTQSPSQSRCVDSNNNCQIWSQRGECSNNPSWMFVNCMKSCNRCKSPCSDLNQNCASWASRGECSRKAEYMKSYCAKSCGTCRQSDGVEAENVSKCKDNHIYCEPWAERGECALNPLYMTKNCKKSCDKCGVKEEDGDENDREAEEPAAPFLRNIFTKNSVREFEL